MKKWLTIFLILAAICPGNAIAQDSGLTDLLEEIEEFEVSIASFKALSIRESPGIVSRVDRKDILSSGARDLIDVLRLVPGFHFGLDVQGVVGVGVRGNWGHEGKVLLLLDGQEINERLYSTLQFGNHFPVDQIQRIEIIRGPGSPLYGGYAELAVINIITRSADDLAGVEVSGIYGQMSDSYARRNLNASFGKKAADLNLTASVFAGQGRRSNHNFVDFSGDSYPMKDNADLNPANINIGMSYKGLQTRMIFDFYRTTSRDEYGQNLVNPVDMDFDSYIVDVQYAAVLRPGVTLTPRLNYKHQRPWHESFDPASDNVEYNKTNSRLLGGAVLSYDVNEKINVILGTEAFQDRAKDHLKTTPFVNDSYEIDYTNFAFLTQCLLHFQLAAVTVGARYDKHDQYGASFVPRFALTHTAKTWHIKALGSAAFRAPSIENLRLNPDIKPEKTTVIEFEGGFFPSESMSLTANIFHVRIKDPIVYSSSFDNEKYDNFKQTGTIGLELEGKLKARKGLASLTYSYYQANDNKVDSYAVPGDDNFLLAFPAHKITLNGRYDLTPRTSLNSSWVYMSKRYGYTGSETLTEFDPVLLLNIFLSTHDLIAKNLSLGVGVYDLFGENYRFIQPYNNQHAPLPGPSREFALKLSYHFTTTTD